ncbi:MAG: hypothetical protein B6I24_01870 [Bacteroidetes bacterium 4572_128]|nr:MAG: hypothetical protein B6I24_01870 [Bacteroidetes bacterium 4572_128]
MFKKVFYILLFILFQFSCSNKKEKKEKISNFTEINLNNNSFNIPSPFLAISLFEKLEIKFLDNIINLSDRNIENYESDFKKSLNLGIYIADFGYLKSYKKAEKSHKCYLEIKKLSSQLKLNNIINDEIKNRIENNLKDSIFEIYNVVLEKINIFLKKNEKNETKVLILIGVYFESLHFLLQNYLFIQNLELRKYIAEQKISIENIMNLMRPYCKYSKEINELTLKLVDLSYDFDAIELIPINNPNLSKIDNKKNLIKLNSEINVVITDKNLLKRISDKIIILRQEIIN